MTQNEESLEERLKSMDEDVINKILGSDEVFKKSFKCLLYGMEAEFKKNSLNEAVKHYESAIRINPNFSLAYMCLAKVYGKKKNPAKAIQLYRKAIEVAPNDKYARLCVGNDYISLAYEGLASIHSQKGDINKAKELYEEVLEINSNSWGSHFGLAMLYHKTNQTEKARGHYEKTVEFNPTHALAHMMLGIFYDKEDGNLDKAIPQYEKALELFEKQPNPDARYLQIYELLCAAYEMKGDIRKVNEYIDRAKEAVKKFKV